MAKNNRVGTPKFIRPYIKDSDLVRFHNVFLATGCDSYTDLITLLLDIYDELGNDNKNLEALKVAKLVSNFRDQLKQISPGLYSKFNELLKEDGTRN